MQFLFLKDIYVDRSVTGGRKDLIDDNYYDRYTQKV
jgi:hypothetical protein